MSLAADRPRRAFRRMDGLFDLELRSDPAGGVRPARGTGVPLDAVRLAELVRRTGGAGDDVRILMAGAGRHTPLFTELAGLLGRDVLISPAGSEPSPAGDDGPADAAYVDASTGRPAPWTVVQPPSMATDLPGWYETDGGAIRARTGMVALPVPGGLMLATRADFVGRRAAAATLMAGHPELTTIGAAVRSGGFVIGDYAGGFEVADGRRFAALLASLPLYGTEVRMWLTWPSDAGEQELLHRNLSGFAETTGAVVWAPDPHASTEVLDGCRDLGVTTRDGGPGVWHAYPPSSAGPPRFEPDEDGRLSPAGRMLTLATDGVSLINVEPDRWRAATDRYTALAHRDGLFQTDLTVLPDGRWAVLYADTDPHVLGPREFQRMLRAAGWAGEDLQLLAHYPAAVEEGFRSYGRFLVDSLRADVWVLPPDADFDVVDGQARAVDGRSRPLGWQNLAGGVNAAWHSVAGRLVAGAPGRSVPSGAPLRPEPVPARGPASPMPAVPGESAPVAPAPVIPPHPLRSPAVPVRTDLAATSSADYVPRVDPAYSVSSAAPAPAPAPAPARPDPLTDPLPVPLEESGLAAQDDDRPQDNRDPHGGPAGPLPVGGTPTLVAAKAKLRHGLYWLADRPRVNAEPVELFVVCPTDPDRAATEGLATPQLFAVGLLRPPSSGVLRPGESLLRVRVAEGGAVDLSSIDVHVPPALHLLLAHQGESYLLPAGLLDRVTLLDGWLAHSSGGYASRERLPDGRQLTLRSAGARHGVEGLPGDVPRWPRAADDVAYTLLPGPRVTPADGALALLSAKPKVKNGHRLLRLRVPRRRAIDVRAAAEQLAGLTSVRCDAKALAGRDIELILPGREIGQVSVLQVLAPSRMGWRPVPGARGGPLADFLQADRF
ncbi:MAG TPA: hypothetical protein VN408_24955 [Actinoplanes sp.]|nr:hypothetical protein [Actinoplanes sp.]